MTVAELIEKLRKLADEGDRALAWMTEKSPAPWQPTCPEARIELRMARSISWDYDRFRYHLDRAEMLERRYQEQTP